MSQNKLFNLRSKYNETSDTQEEKKTNENKLFNLRTKYVEPVKQDIGVSPMTTPKTILDEITPKFKSIDLKGKQQQQNITEFINKNTFHPYGTDPYIAKLPPKYRTQEETSLDIAMSGVGGVLDSLTLGAFPYALNKISPELSHVADYKKKENPKSYMAGNLAGYVIPGIGAEKLVGGALEKGLTKLGASAVKKAGIKVAGEGALMGVAQGGFDAAKNNENVLSGSLNTAKDFALFGGILGSAGKSVSKFVKPRYEKFKTGQELKNIDSSYDKLSKEGISSFQTQNKTIPPPRLNTQATTFDLKPNNDVGSINSPLENIKPLEAQPQVNHIRDTTKMMEPPVNFEHIKRIEELPTDAPTLEAYVKDMQTKQDSGMAFTKMNLQLFGEAQKRLASLSKVYTNTIAKTDMFNEAEKNILNSSFTNDAQSTVKSEMESVANAKERLSNDYNGELKNILNQDRAKGEETDIIFGLLEQEKLKARKTGDYTKVRQIASEGAKAHGRDVGQGVQAFAKYSRTTEGKIVEGVRTVENTTDDILKNDLTTKKLYDGDIKET